MIARTPKVRIQGDVDLAQPYIGDGKALLLIVKAEARRLGVPIKALHRVYKNGTIIRAAVFGEVQMIDINVMALVPEERREKYDFTMTTNLPSRLYWVPEGIVCTPRSRKDAKDGWGIPGNTPGGMLPQVLINHYQHNNYPDVLFRLLNPPPAFKAEMVGMTRYAIMTWMTAPGLYMDYEHNLRVLEFTDKEHPNYLPLTGGEQPIGIYDPRIEVTETGNTWPEEWGVEFAEGWLPLVDQRGSLALYRTLPVIREPKSDSLFIHKPQPVELMRPEELEGLDPEQVLELLMDLDRFIVVDDITADVFAGVDRIRSTYGKMRINPMPLRGDYGVLSDMVLTEVTGIGTIPHESEDFREGYQLFADRVRRALKPRGAENLVAAAGPEWPSVTLGDTFLRKWEESPIHLENIVEAWPTEDDPDFSYGALALRTRRGLFSDEQGSFGATFAAQTFTRTDMWPWPKIAYHTGPYGTVGWSSENSTSRYHCPTGPTTPDPQGIYHGPSLLLLTGYVALPPYREQSAIILGAALCGMVNTVEDDRASPLLEAVRVAVLVGPFGEPSPVKLRIETWALQDLPSEEGKPLYFTELELPGCTRVTRFNFDRLGVKGGAVAYYQLEPYSGRVATVLRVIFNDGGSDDNQNARVNPGTGAVPIRYKDGKLEPGELQELMVRVDVDTQDRDRVDGDDDYYAGSTTIRYNKYRATCNGEYIAYLDYDDAGTELVGRVRVAIETEVSGSFGLNYGIENLTHAFDRDTGRNWEDGELGYNFLNGSYEIKLPDSRGFPRPPDGVYRHIEKVDIVVDGEVFSVVDYTNLEHFGVGEGYTKAIAHLDIRNLDQTLAYKSSFAAGGCREVWEFNGQEVGTPIENGYEGVNNFLGKPRFIPPISAGSAIRQGVGRVMVISYEDHFPPPYPNDLINEKYFSSFRVATTLYPWDTLGGQAGIPLDDFSAVLSPDVNEGGAYRMIAGTPVTDSPFENSWRVGPRQFHAVAKAPLTYPVKDDTELVRAEQALEYRGQVVNWEGHWLMATGCAALLGNPKLPRDTFDYWESSIEDLADKLGIDEFDNIGDIGVA